MSVPEARSRYATLTSLPWDHDVIARELARATAEFLTASPQVSPVPDAPGTWWIGATGFDELGGERLLACTLQQLARAWHPDARVGIADSCVAARAATWASSRAKVFQPRIVPPGGCAAYLANAPVSLVPMNDELRDSLASLGIRTAGAFAALPPGDVEQRWGPEGIASWRLANGDDMRRPVLTRTDVTRCISTELSMSAHSMEPVLFILRGALGQLVNALVHDGRAAATIAITITLDDGRSALLNAQPHTVTREVRMSKPLARVAPLFERCRALLDEWKLTAPICAVSVAITATAPMGAEQGDLLARAWRDPAVADAAFERLRSTLGADSVVRPVARDEHRPDLEAVWAELYGTVDGAPKSGGAARRKGRREAKPQPVMTEQPAGATRFLETPEAITIETTGHIPRAMHWRGQWIAISRAAGPEYISGDWWKGKFARSYWRCESDDLARDFLLYKDGSGWRLQGWYD